MPPRNPPHVRIHYYIKLFLKAAELGSHAFHELGILYGTGCKNLKPNSKQARFCLEKSLESGFEATIASDPEWFKNSTSTHLPTYFLKH